jgi:hypothetical protein
VNASMSDNPNVITIIYNKNTIARYKIIQLIKEANEEKEHQKCK